MSFSYKLINNSSCGTLVEYQNNTQSWASPCLYNAAFQYTGNNLAYKNQYFYIKKENDGRFSVYSAEKLLIGGQYYWVPVGAALLSSN
ncbi:hypothetical protein [Nitrosomonas sp. Nm58]|uniref:hypothetical protein n=1 Tax=Nitrosomonas sp. Nm58 TaxID=200126 RepID=UPI0008983509|nr:hypothetical protein [Nitrosomonas sp. Nm58]SDY26358.1 hypothetical protein SAMN05421754_100514 [Nitrosomonas sp. Nm58]